MAGLAVHLGCAASAALLYGQLQRLREETVESSLNPLRHQPLMAAVRQSLQDDDAFDRGWNEGRSWTCDEAVRHACAFVWVRLAARDGGYRDAVRIGPREDMALPLADGADARVRVQDRPKATTARSRNPMSHAFADIAFTPSVKAAQQRDGSRASYARNFERPGETVNHVLGGAEMDFIAAQRSFYLATVSETGWPYVQHRGGPVGFLKVLAGTTLAFADYGGNRQFVSIGNLTGNDRVALILVDYAQRVRLKLLGRLQLRDLAPGDALSEQLVTPGYRARAQRAFVIEVEGFDWNCPQHIPQRFEAEDVEKALTELHARIADLESQLAACAAPPSA